MWEKCAKYSIYISCKIVAELLQTAPHKIVAELLQTAPHTTMDAIFAQSLSYCWIMDTDLNWGKWGLQFFLCCSGFFCDHCSKFSPFVYNGSHCGSLESQSLRNGFVTLSRLIDVNDFVSHLFFNFFRLRHDVLLF